MNAWSLLLINMLHELKLPSALFLIAGSDCRGRPYRVLSTMRTILATLAAFALFAADEAPAPKLDRIILTNGRALAGTIESEADDHYMIKLAAGGGGALLIKKDRVESVVRGVEEMPKPTAPAARVAAEVPAAENKDLKTGSAEDAKPVLDHSDQEKKRAGRELIAKAKTLKKPMSFQQVKEILGNNCERLTFEPIQRPGFGWYHWVIYGSGVNVLIDERDNSFVEMTLQRPLPYHDEAQKRR